MRTSTTLFGILAALSVLGVPACGHSGSDPAPAAATPLAASVSTASPTFFENRLRGFVYYWFSLFDSNAPHEKFLEHLAEDQNLEIRFPEATLHSAGEFRHWYEGILKKIKVASHSVQSIRIQKQTEREFTVYVDVVWRGVPYQGETSVFHANQEWHVVVNGPGFDDIRIRKYLVVSAP